MNLPFFRSREKPLRMAWQVEKDGRVSYLVGTAHFFPYSFNRSLANLIRQVETVIFEGPLDEPSMQRIAEHGRQGNDSPALIDLLEPKAVQEINKLLNRRLAPQSGDGLYLLLQPTPPNYVELYTRGLRPWMAFFSLWSTCLDWPYSVDMEAYQIARRLDKQIQFLETIEEQLAVLDGIPLERITRQLNDVDNWSDFSNQYVNLFLRGDLANLQGLTQRFATRGRVVINDRDAILFERMKPVFDREETVALVGFPHVPGVSRLFLAHGYHLTQGIE